MSPQELFEVEQAVTIREIAAEASRLTGVTVRPPLVRKIRKQLSNDYHERSIDDIDAGINPWRPNGHINSSGRVGSSYTFTSYRAGRLLREVVRHVQSQFSRPARANVSPVFGLA